ncbi:cobaltochelatase subunit CobN [Methanolobus sp. WCC4]|uniref:cobaltochelatase subunit CobN n=1 Tax=Methanolobus sp. WCC4 TaxID=3125784 RepID=UPI0030F6E9AF
MVSLTGVAAADEQKINITYISFASHASLEEASTNGSIADDISFTFIQGYGPSGPSDELMEAAENGFLETQDIIFCYMLYSGVYDPISEYLYSAHNNNVSLIDLTSAGVPEFFDYSSNGKQDDPICYYYSNMGVDTDISKRYGENLLMYLSRQYSDRPEITDQWPVIKITYTGWGIYSTTLERASWTNPYSQNMEFAFIPAYNYSTYSAYCDEIIDAGENGTLRQQDAIFCEMMNGDIYNDTDQWLLEAHNNNTTLIDIYSKESVVPEYFDHKFSGSENITLINSYKNIESEFATDPRNAENFLICIAKEYTNRSEATDNWNYVDITQTLPDVGLYHPDYEDGYFESTEQYLNWYQQYNYGEHRVYNPSRPTIGMWFHREDIQSGQTQVIDALIKDLESKDCNVIAGFDTFDDIMKYYSDEEGQPLVQCVISLKSFRLNYWDNEKGLEELEALDVPVLRGIVVEETGTVDPADANRGIPNSQVVRKTIGPNVDGIFEFIVIGKSVTDPETDATVYQAMDTQVDWIANRSINWAELKLNENKDKKVAIIYYNYPSGKDNIGASYLNVIESTRLLLEKMNNSDFNVTGVPENDSLLLEMIQEQGINAGSWAPGVMNEMVENRTEWGLQLIPMETYHEWFETEIPENLKEQVITEWGEPWAEELPQNKSLMIWENDTGEKFIVIPTVQFGDVWIMPQPARGFLQNDDALYHSSLVPPPHQYIAFYLWLNDEWDADAIIHLGTHGTHEWLPGQAYGLNRSEEWAPVLLQDLPNIYPYIVANVGEGLTAEYRGNALIIDHLTPTLGKGGIYGELGNVSRYIQQYYGPELDERTKKAYQDQIIRSMTEAHLDSDLDVDTETLYAMDETNFSLFVKNVLHEYIEDISSENIPFGLHTLGEVPSTNMTDPDSDELSMMVRSMMGSYFDDNVTGAYYPEDEYPLGIPLNDTKVQLLVWEVITNGTSIADAQMAVYNETNASVALDLEFGLSCRQNLLDSSIEMDRIIYALSAGFIPAGPGTDPIMNPNAVPTGRNFYGVNPELYPSAATWEIGKTLAQDMIDQYYIKYGEYPSKVAFSRFGVEFIRDHGTLEAEALYLLGVQPVWDRNGKVTGVELIPEDELLPNYNSDMPGRPRIDIVYATAGMRDAFPNKLKMLDEAVRLANTAEQGEYPNYVNESTQAIYQALYENLLESMNETEAHELATTLSTMRCFAVMDGTYEIAVGNAVSASGTWENESEIAELYIDKMGYAYGTDLWGYDASELLRENLRDVDAAIHSDNSNLYDTLDNDDFYQYFGGLSLAIEHISGKAPELFVSSGKDPTNFEVVPFKEYFMENIRSRYLNPTWIDGMMREGYAGAGMFSSAFEYLWGWDVTTDVVSDNLWEEFYQTYVNNPKMKDYWNQYPDAYQSVLGRMIEAIRMEYWDAPDAILENLVNELLDSVIENGPSCCHHVCGNPLMDEFIQSAIDSGRIDVSQEKMDAYKKIMDDLRNPSPLSSKSTSTQSTASPTKSQSSSSTGTELNVVENSGGNQTYTDAGAGENMEMEASMRSPTESNYVEGYEMTKDSIPEESKSSSYSVTGSDILASVLVLGLLGIIAAGFRKRMF